MPAVLPILYWVELAMLVVILVSLFEDKLNAWFARKRLLPGTEHAAATFEEDGYVSATSMSESKSRAPSGEIVPVGVARPGL